MWITLRPTIEARPSAQIRIDPLPAPVPVTEYLPLGPQRPARETLELELPEHSRQSICSPMGEAGAPDLLGAAVRLFLCIRKANVWSWVERTLTTGRLEPLIKEPRPAGSGGTRPAVECAPDCSFSAGVILGPTLGHRQLEFARDPMSSPNGIGMTLDWHDP